MTSATGTATRKRVGIGDILMKLGPLMVLTILFIVFSIALPDKFLRTALALILAIAAYQLWTKL